MPSFFKKPLFIIILTSVFSLVLGTYFALLPLLFRLEKIAKDIKAQEEAVKFFQEQNRKLQEAAAVYSTSQAVSEQTKNIFVNPKAPISFIEFLEKLAKEQEVLLQIIPKSKTELKPWKGIAFSLNIKGPFLKSLNFLNKLENAPFLVEISQVTINRLDEKEIRALKQKERLVVGDTSMTISLNVATSETIAEQTPEPNKNSSK